MQRCDVKGCQERGLRKVELIGIEQDEGVYKELCLKHMKGLILIAKVFFEDPEQAMKAV